MNQQSVEPIIFDKEFTRQEPIPEAGIRRAVELMQSGRLHRYNTIAGEAPEVALLEKEYAAYVGARYCLGVSSCGSAIYIALKSVGVVPGDRVLCNAFTLAPVPGAIENAGAVPVFVEITDDYLTDLVDLEKKAEASGAKFLLLSHMRGHIVDMDRVADICRRLKIVLIEDCAHTVGCRWDDRFTGTFGLVGCYSSQTYKHMNSGEGGLLVTNDDDVMAKAILYSGSYMLYESHISRPSLEVFERHKTRIPNFSLRMSNLTAALIRPQLTDLERQCRRWNQRHDLLAAELDQDPHIRVPRRHAKEGYVGSSLQFTLTNADLSSVRIFLDTCARRGVHIKWFGAREPVGFTSSWESWQYITEVQSLPNTRRILDFMCDFRIPLTFSLDDCRTIARIIREVVGEVLGSQKHTGNQTQQTGRIPSMTETARIIVKTDKAPEAIGPYSQAIKTDTMVFVSGQLALDPVSGALVTESIEAETRQALNNLKAVLEAAGSSLERVIKTTLFIGNMNDFPLINEVYSEFFTSNPPARACVEVARLPKDAHFEVEAVALLND